MLARLPRISLVKTGIPSTISWKDKADNALNVEITLYFWQKSSCNFFIFKSSVINYLPNLQRYCWSVSFHHSGEESILASWLHICCPVRNCGSPDAAPPRDPRQSTAPVRAGNDELEQEKRSGQIIRCSREYAWLKATEATELSNKRWSWWSRDRRGTGGCLIKRCAPLTDKKKEK
jgi:hypothetical protein